MSNRVSPSDLVREWVERVWNQKDAEAIRELSVEDFKLVVTPEITLNSREDFIGFHAKMLAGFDSIHMDVLDSIECGDRVAGICRVHVTKGEKKAVFDFGFTGSSKDGRFTEAHNVVDFLEMVRQFGLVEDDIIDRALS